MVNLDYLYNPEDAKPLFSKNHFFAEKLGFQVVEKGMLLPRRYFLGKRCGGVANSEGKIIDGTLLHRGNKTCYAPPSESIQHSFETVVYLGMIQNVWGHQITDCAKYFWFLKSEIFKSEFKNCPVVYISSNKPNYLSMNGPGKNFRRFLEILEINIDECRMITQPTQFEKIIVPDESFFHDTNCMKITNEYREMIERVRDFALKNRTPVANKKIYYFHGRTQMGEERLAQYFKEKGYEIIKPENLTLDEQLNWLINCESFASTLGSCAHNSIFLRDGTHAIFIPRYYQKFTGYQMALNHVNSLNVNYIDSSLSIFFQRSSYFCYIISKQLKQFFGDRFDGYEEEDFKIFLEYTRSCLNNSLSIMSRATKDYDSVFSDFMVQLKQHKDLIMAYNMPPNWEKFKPSDFCYQTHISGKGWGLWNSEDQISNDIKQKHRIEAIKINFQTHKVYYSVYYNEEEGWSEEVATLETAGTTGKNKPIYGMKVRLDETGAKEFDILYRMHKFDGTWTPWAKNGEALYSHDVNLNAIQIKLESIKTRFNEEDIKKFNDYTQTFWLKNGKIIYLQGIRQDLTQIKW